MYLYIRVNSSKFQFSFLKEQLRNIYDCDNNDAVESNRKHLSTNE